LKAAIRKGVLMSRLYKPLIVEYRLPDGSYRTPNGQRVTKDTPDAVKSSRRSPKWYGRYTDGAGHPCRVPLSESKETSCRMLAKIAGNAQLESVGIGDRYAKHRARPLLEHLEDFRRYLAAKGNVPEYVANTYRQARAVTKACKFHRMDDIEESAVVEFLATLRQPKSLGVPNPSQELFTAEEVAALLNVKPEALGRMARRRLLPCQGSGRKRRFLRQDVEALIERHERGAGVTTSNHYLTSIKAFTKWLVKDRRNNVDPLFHLSRLNAEVDLRHPRRALGEDPFSRFIELTGAGATFRGLTGSDRLVLYTLAAQTGFRASELGSLSPGSFGFYTDPPTVTVRAAHSKHRRKDVQPLRPDVAEMMRQYSAARPKDEPLWPGTWTLAAAEMLRGDLEAAGIPYQDDDGRYFDFHAMRGQFISFLAAGGVHPKVAQTLARHSTITLTMDHYTHLDVLDVAGALDTLPAIRAEQGANKAPQKEARLA
jgi:excisionase family DNA binding protein